MKKVVPFLILLVFLSMGCSEEKENTNSTAWVNHDVTVKIDTKGIPHIEADNLRDLFFAQGYFEAKNRMYQMDMMRRRILGTKSEIFGKSALGNDIFMRSLNFGGIAEKVLEWLKKDRPKVFESMEGYVDGVNAYLEAVKEGKEKLSPLFKEHHYFPEKWKATDSLAIDKGLTFSLSSGMSHKLTLTIAKFFVGFKTFDDLIRFAPSEKVAILPNFFKNIFSPENYSTVSKESDLKYPNFPDFTIDSNNPEKVLEGLRTINKDLTFAGSNNWVISGDKTEPGCPILENDMHEGIGDPPTFVLEHLQCKKCGYNAVGMSFPGTPVIQIGFNDNIAWGATVNLSDDTDIYYESLREEEGTVEFKGKRVKVEKRIEKFKVKNGNGYYYDEVPMFIVPHHGPVINVDNLMPIKLPLHLSVKWSGYTTWTAYDTFYGISSAKTVKEAMEASKNEIGGPLNFVFADRDGNIGYTGYAKIEKRYPKPLFPYIYVMPGNGDYEYNQYLDYKLIPHTYNPPEGYVATANNDPVGNTFDNNPTNDKVYIGYIYDSGFREYRIKHLIEYYMSKGKITVDIMKKIETDTYSRIAERYLPYLFDAYNHNPQFFTGETTEAISILKKWNYMQPVTAVAPTIFSGFYIKLFYNVLHDNLGAYSIDNASGSEGQFLGKSLLWLLDLTKNDIYQIEAGEKRFPTTLGIDYFDDKTTPQVETRDYMLAKSLKDAISELKEFFGNVPMNQWQWGKIHTLTIGPDTYPYDGGLYSIDVADFRYLRNKKIALPFNVNNSPSERMIVKLCKDKMSGDFAFPGGNNENQGNRHYNDLLKKYVNNQYFTMDFYEDQINNDLESEYIFSNEKKEIVEK